jgi:hypothetical protein
VRIHPTTVAARLLLPQVELVRTEFVLTNMALCGFPGLEPASRQPPENLDFGLSCGAAIATTLATRRDNEGVPVTSNDRISVSLHI